MLKGVLQKADQQVTVGGGRVTKRGSHTGPILACVCRRSPREIKGAGREAAQRTVLLFEGAGPSHLAEFDIERRHAALDHLRVQLEDPSERRVLLRDPIRSRRVIPDPYHPGMIYITTFGGSVWYGSATGDPSAVEDIVTPSVAYHR